MSHQNLGLCLLLDQEPAPQLETLSGFWVRPSLDWKLLDFWWKMHFFAHLFKSCMSCVFLLQMLLDDV